MRSVRSLLAALTLMGACSHGNAPSSGGCDASIDVPDGFCATVVADTVGRARHLAVRSNGDIFVARLSSRRDSGGVSAIRGDSVVRFGSGSTHGLVLANDSSLYVSTAHEVIHYRFGPKELTPLKRVDTVVVGLPSGPIPSHSLALDASGHIYVNVSAIGVGCAGKRPCPDLATTAGIWRFETGKKNQTIADGVRIATGLRDAIALAVGPDSMVYAVTHGPDSLHERFPSVDAFTAATHPGDEMVRIAGPRLADFGWPYCYFDIIARTRVQSPEYGGDGTSTGDCDRLIRPLVVFQAHWEPMAIAFASSKSPAAYHGGAFVGFHGSSHRAPLPEDGYSVVYVPFKDGMPTMSFAPFAQGFAGSVVTPSGAQHRVAGLAVGADGALYVSDDKGGRIWKIAPMPSAARK